MANGEVITTPDAAHVQRTLSLLGMTAFLQRDSIAEDRRTQGKDALGRFRRAVADVRRSVVEIYVFGEDEPAALGTVVDATGLVITKASEVPDGARCRLPGGHVTPVQVVGIDPAYDLALLRVPAAGLVPVTWAKSADLSAGTVLATAGTGELPVAVGIVSIPRRDTPGPHPSAPSRSKHNPPAAPPWLTGTTVQGVGYRVETSEGNAAAADIRPGDVILTIAGSPVPDNDYSKKAVGINRRAEAQSTFQGILGLELIASSGNGRRAGERVPVRLLRGVQQIELSLKLKAPSDLEFGFVENMCFNNHADVPPTVITADIPVLKYECGAPVVGVDGIVVGLVISRFGPTGSFIIPGDRVAARLADLRAGKPLSGFPTPSTPPAAAPPNTR
jgi:S1-C subfamily serine protease